MVQRFYLTHPEASKGAAVQVSHEVHLPDGGKAIADMLLPAYGQGIMQRLLRKKVPGAVLGNVVAESESVTPF